MAVEPLTRRSKDFPNGMRRWPENEAEIDEAARLLWPALRARLLITDRAAPGFLREETLVYLCRRARRVGNGAQTSRLCEVLLARSAGAITKAVKKVEDYARQDAAEAIREMLLDLVLDVDTDRADFFQVVYFQGLERIATHVRSRFRAAHERAEQMAPLVVVAEEGSEQDETPHEAEIAGRSPFLSTDYATHVREHLDLIEDARHREAFVLRYLVGLQVAEVAKHFGVIEKTVFNWLKDAATTLAAVRGGAYDAVS
jgi:hypothetical protein